MRVLFLHQTFPSANEEGSGRAFDFAKQLVSEGHKVTVIAGRFSYLIGKEKSGSQANRMAIVREEHPLGFTVLRPWCYTGYHRSYFSRILTFLTYSISSLVAALRAGKFDLIVGASPPIFVAISAALAARIKRTRYVFEIRDLWSEVAISLGFLRSKPLISLVRWVEGLLYRFADRIVINSPGFLPYLEERGVPGARISYVPNGVDLEVFGIRGDGRQIRRELGLEGKTVAVYAGSLGMANDIDTIIEAAELGVDKGLVFLLVGDGKERPRLEEKCRQKGVTNIIFTGPKKKQDVPKYFAAADAGLVTLLDTPLFRTVYPNKLFDTLACGKPVILAVDGVARQLVEEARAGVCVHPAEAGEIVDALVFIRDHPEEAGAMGQRGRAYVEKHFDRWHCAKEMERVLFETCSVNSR